MVAAEALPVLVLDVEDLRLAIDLDQIVEISLRTEVTPLPQVPAPITGVVHWRGHPLMCVRLREPLGLPPRAPSLFDHFVVVRTPRRMLALEIDRVIDVDTVPRAEITDAPPSARPIGGVVALPSGIHYVVDLETLLDLDQERAFDQALERAEAEP